MCTHSSDHSDTTAHSSTPASDYSDNTSTGTRFEVHQSDRAQLTSESSTMSQAEDESSIVRRMDQPKMTTEAMKHSSKIIYLITELSTRPFVNEEDIDEEEESWEDFDWKSSGELIRESSTSTKSAQESSSRSNTVTLPPSLLEDVGGDWGDDFDDMWEEGWK